MVSEDYEKLTVVELKKLIKQRGLSASGARKADLVKCLQEDEGTESSTLSYISPCLLLLYLILRVYVILFMN